MVPLNELIPAPHSLLFQTVKQSNVAGHGSHDAKAPFTGGVHYMGDPDQNIFLVLPLCAGPYNVSSGRLSEYLIQPFWTGPETLFLASSPMGLLL